MCVVQDAKQKESLNTVGGNANCYSYYEKQPDSSSKPLNIKLSGDLAILFLGLHPKISEPRSQRAM